VDITFECRCCNRLIDVLYLGERVLYKCLNCNRVAYYSEVYNFSDMSSRQKIGFGKVLTGKGNENA